MDSEVSQKHGNKFSSPSSVCIHLGSDVFVVGKSGMNRPIADLHKETEGQQHVVSGQGKRLKKHFGP